MYDIEIEEVLERVVKVKANSVDDAIDIVKKQYKNEEIVLDENDFMGVEFREYKDLCKEKNRSER